MDQNSAMPSPAASTQDAALANGGVSDVVVEVANKIFGAKNVLVALSSDPSVDEMAAAIGLTLYLDRLGKRATAIYSGVTPNALEFLKPEDTFESTADTLQDFVIALNKERADHLRYKLDGDFVKIYITPYKTKISERDLEFSYGDYNVDLVLALDVVNGADLDSALREHGRIMHDAVVINITTGNPGKFGEIEWSDKKASSVSEMISRLLYNVDTEARIEKDDATAFLTGIVAATNRFSNAKTTPETMQVASKLMESGANQQLVSKNITPEVENELFGNGKKNVSDDEDPTKLKIVHGDEAGSSVAAGDKDTDNTVSDTENVANAVSTVANENAAVVDEKVTSPTENAESDLMNDLKMAEKTLSQAGSEAVPEAVKQPVKIESGDTTTAAVESELNADFGNAVLPEEGAASENLTSTNTLAMEEPTLPQVTVPGAMNATSAQIAGEVQNSVDTGGYNEKVIQPPEGNAAAMPAVEADSAMNVNMSEGTSLSPVGRPDVITNTEENPASAMAPQVPSGPEANGIPEMNYMPMPDQGVLPPPPTPPIDMGGGGANTVSMAPPSMPTVDTSFGQTAGSAVAMPEVTNGSTSASDTAAQPTSLGPQPAMQDQVYVPQATDPGAFKIPGLQ